MSGHRVRGTLTAGAVVLALAVGIGGCGGSDDPSADTETTTTRAPRNLAVWAARVCVGIGAWNEALVNLQDPSGGPAPVGDPVAGRDALGATLARAVAATDALLAELDDAGAAPTPGGAGAAALVRDAFTRARATLQQAATDAPQLPVDSAAAFTAARDTLGATTLAGLTAAGAVLDGGSGAPALDRTLAATPVCAPAA